jgi:hypothetical protein
MHRHLHPTRITLWHAVHAVLNVLLGDPGPATPRSAPTSLDGHDRAASRQQALRQGWNDAAWGRPPREPGSATAAWYAQGYRGGQVYRRADPTAPHPPPPGRR